MAADLAIEVVDLHKKYRDGKVFKRDVHALRGVSLAIPKGEIFGLLGPNGAGKTTLIKVLLGLVRGSGGTARLLGRAVGDRHSRRRVGYLPEGHRFPQHHTGHTALEYFGGLSGLAPSEVRRRSKALLELVGLGDWGGTQVRKYSKGMQQRLGMAQAMLHDPELLILDEPTDGVDPVGRKEMRTLLQNLKTQGKTVFINSHLLQEVELVCDRVAILNGGEVRRIGRMEDLTQGPRDEFTFSVLADEPAIRRALVDFELADVRPLGAGQTSASLVVADQAMVDRVIDALRLAAISITEMSGRRRTLEDAFLEVIATGSRPATAGRAVPVGAYSGTPPAPTPSHHAPAIDAEIIG